jgi:carboxymethylenebutenolidase
MPVPQPDGYLATPASGTGRPVLVLHAWWGLNHTIKALCDRLAAEGFVAFAPDLYDGKVTASIDEADPLSNVVFENRELAYAKLDNVVAFLTDRAGGDIAVIGFSLGAFFALALASRAAEQIAKVVIFYGTGPDDFTASKAAFLGHFAENDPYEEREYIDALEQALKDAGRPVTFHHYPGTGHWFFEPDRADAYNAGAASLAWERTLAFLRG